MTLTRRPGLTHLALVLVLAPAALARAQAPVLASMQPPPAPAASAPAMAASAPAVSNPPARRTVIEDRGVRIEEIRVGGQPQRITVQSKLPGAKPYEITVGPAGRDINKDHGAAGQSSWSVFDF